MFKGERRAISPEAKARVSRYAQKAKLARMLFPLGSGNIYPSVNHNGTGDTANAAEYLSRNGAKPEETSELFNGRGAWRFEEYPYPLDLDFPDRLDRTLKAHLLQLNRLIDRSLDGAHIEGFNRHGDGHTSRVVKTAIKLVRESTKIRGIEDSHEQEIVAILAGRLHDVGNLFSRKAHNFVSDRMTKVIVPEVAANPKLFAQVRKTITLHPDNFLYEVTTGFWPNISQEKRWEGMVKELGIGGLAVIIGDKTDVGRERISDKVYGDSIFRDPHAETNYWGKNAGVVLDGNTLVWKLQYTPRIDQSDILKYPHFAPELRRLQEDPNYKPRFYEEWVELFLDLYKDKIIAFANCGFALFPNVRDVEIVFRRELSSRSSVVSSLAFQRRFFDEDARKFLGRDK